MPRPATTSFPASAGPALERPARLCLAALLVLQAAAGFLPAPLLWGADALAWAPWAVRLLWPAFALALILSPAAAVLGRRAAGWLGSWALGSPLRASLALPLAAAPLLWLLRDRGRLLGDGVLACDLLESGRRFHGFDFLSFHLHARLFDALGLATTEQARGLFAATSIGAGVLYLALAGALARRLAVEPAGRALAWLLLVLTPAAEIFLGYAECYAFLGVAALAFAGALGLHYLRRASLGPAAWALAAALALHLDALLLAPILAAAAVWPARRPGHASPGLPVRLAAAGLPPLLGLAAAGLLLAASGQGPAALLREGTAPMSTGPGILAQLAGRGGLLDWRHWKDAANLVLLLAPIPTALLLARPSGEQAARDADPRGARLLAGGALWIAALAVLLHMKLGPPRDWDLLAAGAPVAAMAAFLRWRPRAGAAAAPLLGAVLVAALALCLPWFWLNAGQERSRARVLAAMGDQPPFARALAHEEAAKLLRRQGRPEEAIAQYAACAEICPANARFHIARAHMLLAIDRPDEAMGCLQTALELSPDDGWALALAVAAEAGRGRHREALALARRVAGRPEEESATAALHGAVAEQLGFLAEAAEAYSRALALAPGRIDVLERLGAVALMAGEHDLAERAFRAVLARQPDARDAAIGLADALWLSCGQGSGAAPGSGAEARLREAAALLERFGPASGQDPRLDERRRELRASLERFDAP